VALIFGQVRRDTAAERLRRLYDARYLDVRSPDRSQENLYGLGPAGRDWLKGKGVAAGAVPRGGLEHHLGVVEAWVQLAASAHAAPGWRLELFRPDWEMREHHAGASLRLVPDGLVRLSRADAEGRQEPTHFALEVDRRTERPPELRRKVGQYEELRTSSSGIFGLPDAGLVFVLEESGSRRQAAVEEILRCEWGGWWLIWDRTEPTAQLFKQLEQTPLTRSPCGKGSDQSVSPIGARRTNMVETGH